MKFLSAAAADPPSLLSLNTPPANTTLFICCLLLLTAQSFAAKDSSSVSKMPPAFQPATSLLISHSSLNRIKRGTHVSRNTSEHKSATAEQRRYRAALISALLKPAAILKLFLCLSPSLPPFSLLYNTPPPPNLPPLPPSSLSFPSVSQGSSFSAVFLSSLSLSACPVTDCTIHINYSWLLSPFCRQNQSQMESLLMGSCCTCHRLLCTQATHTPETMRRRETGISC